MSERQGGATVSSALESVACSVLTVEPLTLPPCAAQLSASAGESMRRLFSVWNRGYKTQLVIAVSAPEALQISVATGHLKRPSMYRKFSDVTDEMTAQDPKLAAALNAGKSGVASHVEDDGWYIGTDKVS